MTGGEPAPPAAALHGREIDAFFKGWPAYRHIALAVSGGADSTALMILADDWRGRLDAPPRLTILTVDHGLRSDAADEATWVKAQAARLGLPHKTLHWTDAKPRAGLQAAARAARYGLMLAFCREIGVDALATAHTADDQAETLLMRLARGSGSDGLAGISPISEQGGVALLRPLLSVTRARLEGFLRRRAQDWIEDPSNRDAHYERVRLRHALKAAQALRLTPEVLALSARRLRRARTALEMISGDFLQAALDIHPAGYGELPAAALAGVPEEIGLRAIARMADMFGGGGRRIVRLARIEALYEAIIGNNRHTATLGGCVFTVWGGRIRAIREFGRIDPAPMSLPADTSALWDGRFAISAAGQSGLTVGALGPEGAQALRVSGCRMALPARAAHALPAIRRGDMLVFVPFANFPEVPPVSWNGNASAVFVAGNRTGRPALPGSNERLRD